VRGLRVGGRDVSVDVSPAGQLVRADGLEGLAIA
jgi:hypothetical protein